MLNQNNIILYKQQENKNKKIKLLIIEIEILNNPGEMKLSQFVDLFESKNIPMSDVKQKYLYKSIFYNNLDLEKALKMELTLDFIKNVDKK